MTEAERYKTAWKARRQRAWLYYGTLAGTVGVLLAAAQLDKPPSPMALAGITLVVMVSATYWFNQFRCPRCREIFFSHWTEGLLAYWGDRAKCEHCGLEIGEIPGEKQT